MNTLRAIIVSAATCVHAAIAAAQCDIQHLAPPLDIGGRFGQVIDVNDRHLVIGDLSARTYCPGGDPFSCSAGAVFAYRQVEGQWTGHQIIVPPDIEYSDRFGSLALDGDRLVVSSASREAPLGHGVAHVYEYNDDIGQWLETERFEAPPSAATGGFAAMALHGDSALFTQEAVVYHYRLDAEGWQLVQSLEAPDGMSYAKGFGRKIKMDEDWAFIGAPRDDTLGDGEHGSVYVYRRDADGMLVFDTKMLSPDLPIDPDGRMYFGGHIGFDGTTLALANTYANRAFESEGVVHIYELDGDRWTWRQEVRTSEPSRGLGLGFGVSVHGDTMVCGAWGIRWEHMLGYAFRRGADGVWRELAIMDPAPAAPWLKEESFGRAAATNGRQAIFGAPSDRQTPIDVTGGAYVFDLDCERCSPDLDADGRLTVFDFLTFLNLFDAGNSEADFDGDGELTIFDFLAFQTAFDAGCD